MLANQSAFSKNGVENDDELEMAVTGGKIFLRLGASLRWGRVWGHA